MALFSQRKGITPPREALQVDSVDEPLRNRLWNLFAEFYLHEQGSGDLGAPSNWGLLSFLRELWHDYFKWPIDTLSWLAYEARKVVKGEFFAREWYAVYDMIEFAAASTTDSMHAKAFRESCNEVLEQEGSAYRFIRGVIVQITGEEEIAAIEDAQRIPDALRPVKEHLSQALHLLADRKEPDFRNSIKESISAVEALAALLNGKSRSNFADDLKGLEGKLRLHPALRAAFEKLYGYTSNADGIRHALLDEASLTLADAKFMLVSCSAFVSYVLSKTAEAG